MRHNFDVKKDKRIITITFLHFYFTVIIGFSYFVLYLYSLKLIFAGHVINKYIHSFIHIFEITNYNENFDTISNYICNRITSAFEQ